MLKDSWGQQLRTSQGTAVIALGRCSGSCLLLYDKVTGYKLLVKQLLVRLPGDPPLTGSTLALKPTPWASSHKRGRGQANSTNWKEKDTQMVKGRDDQCPWVGWTCLSATSCPPGPHAWAGTQTLGKARFRSGLSAAPPAFLAWQEETCPLLLLVNLPLRGVKRGLGVVFVAEDTWRGRSETQTEGKWGGRRGGALSRLQDLQAPLSNNSRQLDLH